MEKKDLKIVFMGTPDFAVASLRLLVENQYNVVAVITAPDKPAGRGQKVQISAVKQYALQQNLPILQPEKLKNHDFLQTLSRFKPDLQIVVAFRMLPEAVWSLPLLGTFNLHASLLPDYRGAAPINWAIINGETETGVTTFFLSHEIDTGEIILQKRIPIYDHDSAGDLHDRLMAEGSTLVLETVNLVLSEQPIQTLKQIENAVVKSAPKLFTETCKINWSKSVDQLFNFIRGLSPYPAAWSELILSDTKISSLKIFETEKEITQHQLPFGSIITDHKKIMKVAVNNGFIVIKQLQLAGKKRMITEDFLRGYQVSDNAKMI
ncbi:methionyl-tRNA formyltransferase [Microbacter margulisiae]|uniref:Methionyl-tRNA formyltransferase n=1 Tax=Microbacter margulisiae TaxID=1350067 RepID=A0A7W5DPA7_9PORP|nr:methionyl-tRNA formyltransferase [Microbacter margulisiae]MBB3186487.1 methionyl-tRNA formyltransferase [Microbacter margulisiae]